MLDLNGTLALDGQLLPVHSSLAQLGRSLDVTLLSADTHGTLEQVAMELGVRAVRLDENQGGAEQKAAYVEALGAESVVAIGNGTNDAAMLRSAALGIVVVGAEGCSLRALTSADVVVASAENALNLLLEPRRLVATLRS
ncbi:MAG: hypothetical protein M0027_16170 [Candidatus Dormibacteraeota bacterium]|nr:hypothetical protein [Candidatus Dormibacteraeota bacterium]